MTPRTAVSLADPAEALARLLAHLTSVETEALPLAGAAGRVLAESVRSDRPSPPVDVSAMDGYAVRLADLHAGHLRVAAEVAIGHAPPALPPGQAVRIFTGGAVPAEAEAVIRREDVAEQPGAIQVPADLVVKPGANIRRQGENLRAGEPVLEPGELITAAVASALAAFGVVRLRVYRKVRVGLIVTGNELLPPEAEPSPWQLRDSNGPQLQTLLAPLPWVDLQPPMRAVDEPAAVEDALRAAMERCDALFLTGGVSMGDHDYVPGAVEAVGGAIIFHQLAQRPGKPMLGAVGPNGQAILGLPGNPVSVLTTARRQGAAVLRKLAGCREPSPPAPAVRLTNPDDQRLGLWWSRLVLLVNAGEAELVPGKGSGDLVAAAHSDGFVLIPPQEVGEGPWPFYPWQM